jgi:peptide chain release factor 1
MFDRLDDLEKEYLELEAHYADPALVADQKRYAEVARRYKELGAVVKVGKDLRQAHEDLDAAREMYTDADGADREMLKDEIDLAEAAIARLDEEFKLLLLPSDPNEGRNVIVEVRGAEGGEEANLFARDLFDMYSAYATRRGWKLEVMDARPSELGGFADITFVLKGESVWSRMKYEGGPHRVQRVPVTESQGRIHTSSATVTVLPEAEDVDVHIDPNDLQVDVYRSSGPGGQSVNTTDSAVRLTHKPTGVVVAMQDQKSQLQNKAKAMVVLRSRLLQLEQQRHQAEQSDQRKGQVGGGGRSEKIRTYNYKENRVTDHRIGLTLYKLDKILAGDLDELSDALLADERSRQLQASDDAHAG